MIEIAMLHYCGALLYLFMSTVSYDKPALRTVAVVCDRRSSRWRLWSRKVRSMRCCCWQKTSAKRHSSDRCSTDRVEFRVVRSRPSAAEWTSLTSRSSGVGIRWCPVAVQFEQTAAVACRRATRRHPSDHWRFGKNKVQQRAHLSCLRLQHALWTSPGIGRLLFTCRHIKPFSSGPPKLP